MRDEELLNVINAVQINQSVPAANLARIPKECDSKPLVSELPSDAISHGKSPFRTH